MLNLHVHVCVVLSMFHSQLFTVDMHDIIHTHTDITVIPSIITCTNLLAFSNIILIQWAYINIIVIYYKRRPAEV